jgi:hypothetical protein
VPDDGQNYYQHRREKMETRVVLGHTFVPMEGSDYEGLAGADEGSFICYTGSVTLVLSPNGTISELGDNTQTDWTPTTIL